MFKIVIDTNLFISAVLSAKGKPAQILDLVKEEKLELFISKPILQEIEKVFSYHHIKKIHNLNQSEINNILDDIIKFAKFTPNELSIKAIKDDSNDDKFLECAIEAKADFIISGDHHLTNLKIFQEIKIVTPTEFIKLLSNS